MQKAPDILLVEDNADEAELARRALTGLDCSVGVVHDGLGALQRLAEWSRARCGSLLPRVVVLDLKLPALGGLEVLRQIRADPTIRAVPVVILTSSNQPSDVRRAYALGANSYLVKPVDFDRFRELMTAAARYWLESNVAPPP